jgi:putative transposase
MRTLQFIVGEYYHVYNRGVDKRDIFMDQVDLSRFYQSMHEFNTINPIGSLYENSFLHAQLGALGAKLVKFIVFCLNPNHYHFILSPVSEDGIQKFMQKLNAGYTMYFNQRYKRTGSLFQGTYKAKYIDSNEYLLHLSAYINLNDRAHKLGALGPKLSSWKEYIRVEQTTFCDKDIILGQFRNVKDYKEFAENSLIDIIEHKEGREELEDFLPEGLGALGAKS